MSTRRIFTLPHFIILLVWWIGAVMLAWVISNADLPVIARIAAGFALWAPTLVAPFLLQRRTEKLDEMQAMVLWRTLAGAGLWLILYFLVQWGFYVFFEMLWAGQSPGKRMLDLRVVKVAGHPVGFFDSVLRNLLRVADQLPLSYGVGTLSMLMTGRFQRLGDLAAGTVVVREQKAWYGMRDVASATALTAEAVVARRVSLSNRERRLLQEFVQRKDRLHPERAEQLAQILARPYAERFGLPMPARATDLLLQIYQGGTPSSPPGQGPR